MATESHDSLDVAVIGAGPAGLVAALRAARLGARTALIRSDALGGMAANDGPVPVRTLAHFARLIREARSLPRFGVTVGDPAVRLPAPPNHLRPPDRILQLIVDREVYTIVGCHIVGERAGELAQLAAIAMGSRTTIEQ